MQQTFARDALVGAIEHERGPLQAHSFAEGFDDVHLLRQELVRRGIEGQVTEYNDPANEIFTVTIIIVIRPAAIRSNVYLHSGQRFPAERRRGFIAYVVGRLNRKTWESGDRWTAADMLYALLAFAPRDSAITPPPYRLSEL